MPPASSPTLTATPPPILLYSSQSDLHRANSSLEEFSYLTYLPTRELINVHKRLHDLAVDQHALRMALMEGI